MRYPWVLFDADETLFHFDAFAGLQRMFSHYDVDFDQHAFAEYSLQTQLRHIDHRAKFAQPAVDQRNHADHGQQASPDCHRNL